MKKNLLGISLITMSCLYGILATVIILIFLLVQAPVIYGIVISIVILILQFLFALTINDWIFKAFCKARFDYEIPEYLKEFIRKSCEKHNMKYPRIGFINDRSPNVFTYNRTKNDARVVITRGILEFLDENEEQLAEANYEKLDLPASNESDATANNPIKLDL